MNQVPMGLRRSFIPFVFSRMLLIMIFALVPQVMAVPIDQWHRDDSIAIKLNARTAEDGLRRVALGNDSAWYLSIAQQGYEQRPFEATRQANWAFFPLHPLLWRAIAKVTGEWFWSGVAMANLLTFAGLSLLWTLAYKVTESAENADSAVMFAAFWPSSYFMLLPQTEPLFFTLVVFAFVAAYSERWWLAGLAGMLAGATRLNGLFLLPSLGLGWLRGERRPQDLLKLLPVLIGAGAFMLYLWSITGNPLAFKDIQIAWGRSLVAPWHGIADYLHHPTRVASPWNPKLLHFLITAIGIASIVTCWRQRWYGMAAFTAMTILAPLLTGTLMSMTRYIGVAPGVYVALSVWTVRRKRLGQCFIALFAIATALLCVSFATGINLGGA